MAEPEPMTDAELEVLRANFVGGNFMPAVASIVGRLLARLDQAEARGAWRPTHRHIKRGSLYQELGAALLQTDKPLTDNARLVIYRGDLGDLWARREAEFDDGRFEPLPAPPRAGGEP